MKVLKLLLGVSVYCTFGWAAEVDTTDNTVIIDDFESDSPGSYPKNWKFFTSHNRQFRPLDSFMSEDEKFYVVSERGNRFLRCYTKGEAQRISLPAGDLSWKLSDNPILSWEWRAHRLPTGAAEDRVNDTGAAVYVSFSKTDWLGRPLSIKYTYSSTLPVGSVVSTGNVKVIVVSSGANGTGSWKHIERNVVNDYREVFRSDPPNEPFTITLWSDSDDTKTVAEVDFDNLTVKRLNN